MSSDAVETILRLERDPLGARPVVEAELRAAYESLDEDGAVRLAEAWSADDDAIDSGTAVQSIRRTALFRDHVPAALIDWMLDREFFDVPIAFRSANASQTQRLIESIASELNTDAVRCLCFCPQPAAFAVIADMHSGGQTFGFHSPQYDGERWVMAVSYTPIIEFALDAGWCFDANGQRRFLYLDACWELLPALDDENPDAFATYMPTNVQCGYCGHPIGCVVPADRAAVRSGGAATAGLFVCLGCGEDLQVRRRPSGIEWSPANRKPSWLGDDCYSNYESRPAQRMRFGVQRPPFHAGLWAPAVHQSKFGGFPFWVQSQAYPHCHGCAQPMLFVAQISVGEFEESSEGDEYHFVCQVCAQSAVVRQTT